MHSLDSRFFDEYKRLDTLCADMYSSRNGVKSYIADMELNAGNGQFQVSSWNADYKMLKRVHFVRNRIAHDATSEQICEESDLLFVQDFYHRILNGQDPLTLLHHSRMESTHKKPQNPGPARARVISPQTSATALPESPSLQKRKAQKGLGCFFGLSLLILIPLLIVLIKFAVGQ